MGPELVNEAKTGDISDNIEKNELYVDDALVFENETEKEEVTNNEVGVDGLEATEIVDYEAMDTRMEALSIWTSKKSEQKRGQKMHLSPTFESIGTPKDLMKTWVSGKSQNTGIDQNWDKKQNGEKYA